MQIFLMIFGITMIGFVGGYHIGRINTENQYVCQAWNGWDQNPEECFMWTKKEKP